MSILGRSDLNKRFTTFFINSKNEKKEFKSSLAQYLVRTIILLNNPEDGYNIYSNMVKQSFRFI